MNSQKQLLAKGVLWVGAPALGLCDFQWPMLLRPTYPFFGLFTRDVGGIWSLESGCCLSHFLQEVSGERLAPSLLGHLGGWSDSGAASRHTHRKGFPRACKRYLHYGFFPSFALWLFPILLLF